MIKITVLVDDKSKKGFSKEHGFSALIQYRNKNILFDTGLGKSLQINSEILNVDVKLLDSVVISHGHYDHTGALDFILKYNTKLKIFAHPDIFLKRFSIDQYGNIKDVSIPQHVREVLNSYENIILTRSVNEVYEGFYISGEIPRITEYEDVGGSFYLDDKGKKKDILLDDQAVWINSKDGLIIITGCCHSGIVNTVKYILKISERKRILALLGGFHLNRASRYRLEKTVKFLNSLEIQSIIPCHCTGYDAIYFFKEKLNFDIVECLAGSKFYF